jgi:hypothetical protein
MPGDPVTTVADATGTAQSGTRHNGGGTDVIVGAGTGSDRKPDAENKLDGSQSKVPPDTSSDLGRFGRLFRKNTSGAAESGVTEEQLQALRTRIRSNEGATDEVAEELSAALRQADRISAMNLYIPGAGDRLNFIVDCLLAPKPQLILARDGRLNLQLEIYHQAGWISRTLAAISSGSPVGLVLSALFIAFIIWSLVMYGLQFLSGSKFLKVDIFFMDGNALGIITFAALIGGIVSIATRLNEFSRVRDLDPFAMFWTAMLKPLIGVVLAIFILATVEGKILSFGFLPEASLKALSATPRTDDTLQGLYVLWVLGFLAGFSERFAWDFVGRAEGAASATPAGDKKKN